MTANNWPEHNPDPVVNKDVAEEIVQRVRAALIRPNRRIVASTLHADVDLVKMVPVNVSDIPVHRIGSEGWLWLAVRWLDEIPNEPPWREDGPLER